MRAIPSLVKQIAGQQYIDLSRLILIKDAFSVISSCTARNGAGCDTRFAEKLFQLLRMLDRGAKYNRLLAIEEQLGGNAVYLGGKAVKNR